MFLNPKLSVGSLMLKEGDYVADFGTGTGEFAKAISEKVGQNGKVYAIEVQKDIVKRLEKELKEKNIKNVDCIWGDIDINGGTKIADHTVDAVVIANVLFQSADKLGLIDEAKRILKPNGKVLLLDWSESFGGMGPSPMHVVKKESAVELFKKRGFRVLEDISPGEHHYGIIFKYE